MGMWEDAAASFEENVTAPVVSGTKRAFGNLQSDVSDLAKDPFHAIGALAHEVLRSGADTTEHVLKDVFSNIRKSLVEDIFGGTDLAQTDKEYQQMVDNNNAWAAYDKSSEENARVNAYNAAITDPDLDPATRDEIKALYESGGNSGAIAGALATAKEGKGMYGVRQQNLQQGNIRKDRPGRSQLMSLGARTVLGRRSQGGM